jgi:hypothetical protein
MRRLVIIDLFALGLLVAPATKLAQLQDRVRRRQGLAR